MEIDNLIEILIRLSPTFAIVLGIVFYTAKKYNENHDCELINRVMKMF